MARFAPEYRSRRVLLQLPLGYASGLPYLLVGETLLTWMATQKIDLKTIGAFSLCGLAYNLKVVWAPLVDRYPLPILGRRRGWLLVFQILLMFGLIALGQMDPKSAPARTAAMAALVAFFAASQDVMVDAYRADVLLPKERGAGMALFQLGYRLGMFAAGTIALVMVKRLGWPAIYRGLALTVLIGIIANLVAPEPGQAVSRPRLFVESWVLPIVDLLRRRRAALILAFIVLYRVGYQIAAVMSSTFLIHVGFDTTDLGYYRKGVGLAATLIGGLLAGPAVNRLGAARAMLVFGIAMALVHLSWIGLVYTGPQHWMLAITIVVENLLIGLTVTAFDAYLMALCDVTFSATQLAALTSLSSLFGRVAGSVSGVLATTLGWSLFFGLTSLLAIPALLLVRYLPRIDDAPSPAQSEPSPTETSTEAVV